MGFIFSKTKPKVDSLATEYGAILEQIERKLVEKKDRRKVKRNKHADCNRMLVFAGFAIGGVLLAFMYLFDPGKHNPTGKLLQTAPLWAFPTLMFLIKKMADWYYVGGIKHLDSEIDQLELEKKEKINELKKRTAYDDTQRLLDAYGEKKKQPGNQQGPGQFNTMRPGGQMGNPNMPHGSKTLPAGFIPPGQGQSNTTGNNTRDPNLLNDDETRAFNKADIMAAPHRRGSIDKFVDYVLGDGPNNRFALICRKCASHNGLVREEDLGLRYRCSACSFLNGDTKPGDKRSSLLSPSHGNASNDLKDSFSDSKEGFPQTPRAKSPFRGSANTSDEGQQPRSNGENAGNANGSNLNSNSSGNSQSAILNTPKTPGQSGTMPARLATPRETQQAGQTPKKREVQPSAPGAE